MALLLYIFFAWVQFG